MKLNPIQVKDKFGPTDVEYGGHGLEAVIVVNGQANSVEFIDLFDDHEGRIGALAAIALSEERTEAAALYNDCALPLIKK